MTATKLPLLLAVFLMQAVAEKALMPIVDFAGPEAAQKWQAVNDGVMGGVSDGRFKITEEKTLEFFGTLSLENNGGFASVRTKRTELGIKAGETLFVRVKGDGRKYVLNIYTKSRRPARVTLPAAMGFLRDGTLEPKNAIEVRKVAKTSELPNSSRRTTGQGPSLSQSTTSMWPPRRGFAGQQRLLSTISGFPPLQEQAH